MFVGEFRLVDATGAKVLVRVELASAGSFLSVKADGYDGQLGLHLNDGKLTAWSGDGDGGTIETPWRKTE